MSMSAGVGLKPAHFSAAEHCPADGLWFEVHPENYMVDGGPRLACLDLIRRNHPLSLHGVGMSLASTEPLDDTHLARFKALCMRLEPALVSEHLAWSRWAGTYVPDLLPVPRTSEGLDCVCRNVSRMQETLGRVIAIENPSHYLQMAAHEMSEPEFLVAVARRTGCALLLDVNNVLVSSHNLGGKAASLLDAATYLDAIPGALVHEIHLAGHSTDPALGEQLLIDSHDCAVSSMVWTLYERLIARIGPRPTLIERDENLPAFEILMAERARAAAVLNAAPDQASANRRLHA